MSDCYVAALRILGYRFNSERELRRKLAAKRFDDETIAATLARLRQEKWLDDERFAGAYVRTQAQKGLGRLRIAAFLINLRTRITRQPWGDQAQFVSRAAFPGFREIPIMEDYDLARRMKPRVLLPLTVITSGRRFLEQGMLRTVAFNWRTILAFHLSRRE